MSEIENNNNIQIREEENELNLWDLWLVLKANWKWFALSVVGCVALACLYLLWAPKQYTRSASILIKEEQKGGGGMSNAMGGFADLSMFGIQRNVDNEVLVFKANRLMHMVAQRLHLDVSYKIKEGLRSVELYRESPVVLSFPDVEEAQRFSFVVKPVSEKEVELFDFVSVDEEGNELEFDDRMTVALNDTVETPVGRMVVVPSLYYTDIYYGEKVKVTKSNMAKVVEKYQKDLQSALASKTATIINLSLTDESISRAEDVLNTLIAVYNEDAIDDKNRITVNTSNFIADRLVIIEKELGNVDASIERFKRENQLTDITSETGMYLENTSAYRKEGLALENQLTLAKYIQDYLNDPQKASDLIPANTGISDVGVEQQIAEYNEMLLKRDKLIANSSNKNPVVMDLNNSLSAMKQTIIRSIDNLVVGLNIKIRNVKAQEEQLTKRIEAVPSQQKHVLSVERQQKIKEELYLYLLNKREENALSQAITENNTRVLDPATGSQDPVAPKSILVLAAAFIMGFAIPAGIIWLMWSMDTKVHTKKEIQDKTTIPFLGEIPEKDKKQMEEVVVKSGSRDAVSEAFRIIRTNMDFMRVKADNMKVIMFTSMNPGAGKTFVSTNLAASLILMKKKVVLVDLDIRKGTLAKNVGYSGKGATNYLSGSVDSVREVVAKNQIVEGLDVLFAGPVPPNPAELLLSHKLDDMIEELKSIYDYVIVDNVPAGVVADAPIVNRVADLTIYVVRSGVLDRRQLPELERLYKSGQFKNLALVLNGVKYRSMGYGYGYGFGFVYGYGYGDEKK